MPPGMGLSSGNVSSVALVTASVEAEEEGDEAAEDAGAMLEEDADDDEELEGWSLLRAEGVAVEAFSEDFVWAQDKLRCITDLHE